MPLLWLGRSKLRTWIGTKSCSPSRTSARVGTCSRLLLKSWQQASWIDCTMLVAFYQIDSIHLAVVYYALKCFEGMMGQGCLEER